MPATNPEVSVVIPAYNEATYIDRLLDALTRQSYKDFEVIVSDAESHDGTDKVVGSFAAKLDIKFIEAPPKGPAFGRNQGAKLARGSWLLFLDADDDIDDPNFIGTLLDQTKKHGWDTATAKFKTKGSMALKPLYFYQRVLAHTKHPVASGYCILTSKAAFEARRGFNEKIQFGEDYDYVTRGGKGSFGFVTSTYYYVDLRRSKEEGLALTIKSIRNEIYRHTHAYNLEENPYKYEFGKHKPREKS